MVPLGLGLLILCSPSRSLGAPTGAPGDLEVFYSEGKVTLLAEAVALDLVIRAVADHAGLRLVQHAALDETVSIDVEARPLPELLDILLDDGSYQLYRAGRSGVIPGTLWIFSPGTAQAPAATAYLEIALVEGQFAEKKEAIRELRRLGTPAAVQALSVALADSDRRIRDAAMEALASIGTEEALAALGSAIGADDRLERGRAANAIAIAGGRSSVEYLRQALRDEDPVARSAAIEALADIDDAHALELVRDSMQDPDPRVRERAVEILESIDDEAAFRAMYQSRGR